MKTRRILFMAVIVGILTVMVGGCMPEIEIRSEVGYKPTPTPYKYPEGDLSDAWSGKPSTCLQGTGPSNNTEQFKGYFAFNQNTWVTVNPSGGPQLFQIQGGEIFPIFTDPWGNEGLSNIIFVCNERECGYAKKTGNWCIP